MSDEKWLIERRSDGGYYLMGAVDRLDNDAEALRLAIALVQATPGLGMQPGEDKITDELTVDHATDGLCELHIQGYEGDGYCTLDREAKLALGLALIRSAREQR